MMVSERSEQSVITLRSELDRLREEIGPSATVAQLEELLLRLVEEIEGEPRLQDHPAGEVGMDARRDSNSSRLGNVSCS